MSDMQNEVYRCFEELVTQKQIIQFNAGEQIIYSSRVSNNAFLLVEGAVDVVTLSGTIIRLDAPNIIGEISLLTGLPSIADVFAVEETSVLAIESNDLNSKLSDVNIVKNAYRLLSGLAVSRASGQYHDKYVAIVAHDAKKQELIEFVDDHRDVFLAKNLVSTENTSKHLEKITNLRVARKVSSGPLGGDQEIGGLITRNLIEAVFFFRDPLWAAPHSADVTALVRLCDVANVPLATNQATAFAILNIMNKSHKNDVTIGKLKS